MLFFVKLLPWINKEAPKDINMRIVNLQSKDANGKIRLD